MNWLDIIGLQVGRLTVVSLNSVKKNGKNKNKAKYNCLCSCGEYTVVGRDELRFERTKSCGCFRLDQSRKAGISKKLKHKKIKCATCSTMFPVPKCREDEAKYCSVACANEGFKRDNSNPNKHVGWEYSEWKKAVVNRDESICIKCRCYCDKPVAHHLLAFARYEDDKYNVDNGVTMCHSCHNDFHNTHSKREFTQVDFIRWVRWEK